MNLITPYGTEVFFLGDRNHVQTSIQLNYALLSIMAIHELSDFSEILIKRYKQVNQVKTRITLVDSLIGVHAENQKAKFTVKIKDDIFKYYLISVPGDLKRIPETEYHYDNLHLDCQRLSATAQIDAPISFIELLGEIVEVTKKLHIECYNNREKQYTFVVGGVEGLNCFLPQDNQTIEFSVKLSKQLVKSGNLYNGAEVIVSQNKAVKNFLLPFIGVSGGGLLI